MSESTGTGKAAKPNGLELNRYPFWAPRFWHGMLLSDWLRLVMRHRCRIHPLRIPMALIVTLVATANSALHWLQEMIYGRAIAETRIDTAPVFIVGHWRSGTTLLHELMVLDDRFAYPTTFECFAPNHFLLTGKFLPRLVGFLLPPKRPMDNMAVSFAHPQEDEFALVGMGAPSPMLRLAFPNDPPPYMEFLDMEGVKEDDLRRWKTALDRFVRMQTYAKRKPLVLKSPPHTGRIEVLSELFPNAKFIHLVRDPFAIFPSMRRLWRALDDAQGLQLRSTSDVDEYVFEALARMYCGFERQRASIKSSCICDVRYEDLTRDPVAQVRRVYEQLELGDFELVREKIEQYVGRKRGYQPNLHELEPEVKAEIRRRWASYIEKYGYSNGAVDN